MLFTFEATMARHGDIEQWLDDQRLVGTCALWVTLFSSGIDCRRDAVLTSSAHKARTLSPRGLELSDIADAILFKATFQGQTDFRIISQR